jgi:hypothetical protein
MVQAAERHAAMMDIENAEFRVLDAERLDLPDDAVDACRVPGRIGLVASRGARPRRALPTDGCR